jgi:hypothetical protein
MHISSVMIRHGTTEVAARYPYSGNDSGDWWQRVSDNDKTKPTAIGRPAEAMRAVVASVSGRDG